MAGLYTATNLADQYALQNKYAYYYNQIQDGVTTDWIKKPLRNAVSSQHSVSIDGGDEHARYNLGVRYGDEEGVMKGSSRERCQQTSSSHITFLVSSLSVIRLLSHL